MLHFPKILLHYCVELDLAKQILWSVEILQNGLLTIFYKIAVI